MTGFAWVPELSDADRRWAEIARDLTRERFAPLAAEIDRDQRYPTESIAPLVESGLTGLRIPREYGGSGGSLSAAVAVAEAIAHGCPSTCTVWMSYAVGVGPLLLAGTEEQRRRVLPEVAAGAGISFALTERHTGSDPSKVQTLATREADGWHLEGEKWMVGNGGQSRFYVLFARTSENDGLTAFLLDAEDGGLVVDDSMDKMGLRGAATTNLKINVHVPAHAQLGELGRGMSIALGSLGAGRVMVAGQACGIAAAALDAAGPYAVHREAFGTPLIDFQAISFRLADLGTELSAARLLALEAAASFDRGTPSRSLSSMAKLYASEMAHRAVDTAVQVFGASGYEKPNIAERLYRDQRVLEIYEGSSEIQRLTLVRELRRHYAAGAGEPS
jgi:alkylation response protein AidB-like acyl-CoA dehydrogenase